MPDEVEQWFRAGGRWHNREATEGGERPAAKQLPVLPMRASVVRAPEIVGRRRERIVGDGEDRGPVRRRVIVDYALFLRADRGVDGMPGQAVVIAGDEVVLDGRAVCFIGGVETSTLHDHGVCSDAEEVDVAA